MYYFIEIQITKDETSAQAIYKKSSYDEALTSFHASLSYAMQGDTVVKAICVILDSDGNTVKLESWERQN